MTVKVADLLLVALGAAAARTIERWYNRRLMFSPIPPEKTEESETILTHVAEMDSTERKVFEWRFEQLESAGFDELRAVSLALKPGDAWRRAIEHVRRGADHKVAAEIEL